MNVVDKVLFVKKIITINAPPAEVWDAITNSELTKHVPQRSNF